MPGQGFTHEDNIKNVTVYAKTIKGGYRLAKPIGAEEIAAAIAAEHNIQVSPSQIVPSKDNLEKFPFQKLGTPTVIVNVPFAVWIVVSEKDRPPKKINKPVEQRIGQ